MLPASAYVEMALASARSATAGSKSLVLENIAFERPLVLSPGHRATVQLHLSRGGDDVFSFDIWGRAADADGNEPRWIKYSTGAVRPLRPGEATDQPPDIDRLRQDMAEEVGRGDLLERIRALGYDYGPSFWAVEQVWKQENRALGRIRLPDACIADLGRYSFHPVLLDACFQVAGLAAWESGAANPDPWIPAAIDRLEFVGSPGPRLWAVAEATSVDAQKATADIRIVAPDGSQIASLSRLHLNKVSPAELFADEEDIDQWFYGIEWRETAPPAAPASVSETLAAPSQIKTGLDKLLPSIVAANDISSYQQASAVLEDLSVEYVLGAFRALGWEPKPGERFSYEVKIKQLGVARTQRRLFNRLLEILAEEGIVVRSGATWEVTAQAAAVRPATQIAPSSRSVLAAELALLERCGPRLAEAIQGKCDSLDLLFPRGDTTLVTQLYEVSPGARAMNTLVQQAVSLALARAKNKRVRILEIGAGTGGTTAAILPHLPRECVEFTFTDISPWFSASAERKFGDFPFMKYSRLDIERDPTLQGYQSGQYDIVIAANVLHATSDLRQTLKNVQTLLARGGLLVLLEGTRRVSWVDMIFGLTEGWWRFADRDLRPSHPLLAVPAWRSLLGQAGFGDVVAVSPFGLADDAESALIVAQAGTSRERRPEPGWLVLADRGGVGQRLADKLRELGKPCHVASAASGFSHDGEGGYGLRPLEEADFRQLVAHILQAPGAELEGIAFLWGLDDDPAACGALLQLIKTLAWARPQRAPRLWLVT